MEQTQYLFDEKEEETEEPADATVKEEEGEETEVGSVGTVAEKEEEGEVL